MDFLLRIKDFAPYNLHGSTSALSLLAKGINAKGKTMGSAFCTKLNCTGFPIRKPLGISIMAWPMPNSVP